MKIAIVFLFIFGFYLLCSVTPQAPEAASEAAAIEPPPNLPESNDGAQGESIQIQDERGICECAVFGTESPAPLQKPVISKSTVKVLCNEEGKEQCGALCRALALAARDNADDTLCQTLGHADRIQPSVFAKVCKEDVYAFTGLTSPKAYCCHDGKPLICNDDTVVA